jgi:hypothetical protein
MDSTNGSNIGDPYWLLRRFIGKVARVVGTGMLLTMSFRGKIGIVHVQARPHDEIYLLRAAAYGLPVVLRETRDGRHNNVGTAYLHPMPSLGHFYDSGWQVYLIE